VKKNYFFQLLVVMSLSFLLISCGNADNGTATQQKVDESSNVETQQKEPLEESVNSAYLEGKDYGILAKEYDTKRPDKVVVYEFFGYTCPHCFHFEPFIEPWSKSKPAYVEFVKVPLNFHPSWSIYQQAYLTAESMGIAEQTHSALFKALHDKNKRFSSLGELAQWYADETGVDKDEFISTGDSFIIDANQRKSDGLGFQMKITGTPTVIVDGKYRILPKKDRQEEIKVLNFLIAKRAKEKNIIQ